MLRVFSFIGLMFAKPKQIKLAINLESQAKIMSKEKLTMHALNVEPRVIIK